MNDVGLDFELGTNCFMLETQLQTFDDYVNKSW